jgi:phosphopantothenoylcysteine synthetase/decarboxylase
MNTAMWRHPVTAQHIRVLEVEWGVGKDNKGKDRSLATPRSLITQPQPILNDLHYLGPFQHSSTMNTAMWRHPVTAQHIRVLEVEWGVGKDNKGGETGYPTLDIPTSIDYR